MKRQILGIHHITAIASDPQANIDFYTGVLGLRLVKVTVNFDDPSTYHLYYGDGVGHPGTILTFFPWPTAPRGRRGTAQVTETAFAVPEISLGYWVERLTDQKISFRGPVERLGEEVISFLDPDGLGIEIVASKIVNNGRTYQAGQIPLQHAIRGFHSATLFEKDFAGTAALLTDTMGFGLVAQDGDQFRFRTDAVDAANLVDVIHGPNERAGRVLWIGASHRMAHFRRNGTEGMAYRTFTPQLRPGA